VILATGQIRLPELLSHIEAGRIVLVVTAPGAPRLPPGEDESQVKALSSAKLGPNSP
jgi:hypothetical protein